MFDMTLFRDPTFAGANTVALLVSLAMFGVFFFISLYMQNVLGYSAVRAGVAFLPMTVLIILVAPFAGRSSDRLGSRWLMTAGMTLVGCSLLVFALSISAYVTPSLMGGTDVLTLPMLIAQQVGTSFNPNFAGALGVVLLLVSLAIVIAYNRILARLSGEQGLA